VLLLMMMMMMMMMMMAVVGDVDSEKCSGEVGVSSAGD